MERLLRLLLIVMFLVLLFVSTLVVVAAFSNHRFAVEMVHRTLADAGEHLRLRGAPNDQAGLSPLEQAYLSQLRAAATSVLDSSTLTFLFAVFGALTLSVWVYLLRAAKKALDGAKAVLDSARNIGLDANRVMAIVTHLHTAHQAAIAVWTAETQEARDKHLPVLRDSMRESKDLLRDARTRGVGFERTQYESFFDVASRTHSVIESLEQSGQLQEPAVAEDCAEVLRILRETDFVQRFERKIQLLGSDPGLLAMFD